MSEVKAALERWKAMTRDSILNYEADYDAAKLLVAEVKRLRRENAELRAEMHSWEVGADALGNHLVAELRAAEARIADAISPEGIRRARDAAWPGYFFMSGDEESLLDQQRATVARAVRAALNLEGTDR